MSTGKKVFIVGPGFIGWNIIDLLAREDYSITGLVRRQEHADGIKASGATPLMRDLNDKKLITEYTAQSDIVFHTATADHLPSAQAVLDGVRSRADKGLMTIYIHTSGASVLDDNARGQHSTDKIYYDDDKAELDSLPSNAPHREINLAIEAVHKELDDRAKIAIMTPPLIYGFNPSHKRLSIPIPVMTRFALKHGYAGYVGEGLSGESNVHVLDLARAYVVLLHHLEKSEPSAEGLKNPYYFCESTGDNEPSWKDVAAHIGAMLHKAGKLKDPTPKSVPTDAFSDLFGEDTSAVVGLNSRSRAKRLRALGWKPIEKDWRQSFTDDELPEILKEEPSEVKGYTAQFSK